MADHLPLESEVAARSAPVLALIGELSKRREIVANEMARLSPPPGAVGKARLIEPPPLLKLTVAVAGASLAEPGAHFVQLYSQEMDLRPELYRMALERTQSDPELSLHICTRRTISLQLAVQAIRPDAACQARIQLHRNSIAFSDSHRMLPGKTLSMVDLDHLHREVTFSQLSRLAKGSNTLFLFGSRDHPLLREFASALPSHGSWTAWGVNREQVVGTDGPQNHLALHAIQEISPAFKADALPQRFHDLPIRALVPSQYRKSLSASGRIWTTVAGAYAIRDAERRTRAERRVLPHPENLPTEFAAARAELASLSQDIRGRSEVTPRVAQWLDDLWFCWSLPSRLTAPITFYLREVAGSNYYQRSPIDELTEIQNATESWSRDSTTMARMRGIVIDLLRGYDSLLARSGAPSARQAEMLEQLRAAVEGNERVVLVAFNEPDQQAAITFVKRWINQNGQFGKGTPPQGVTTLAHVGIDVIPARAALPHDAHRVIVPRYPSSQLLDKLLTSRIPRLTFVVPSEEYKRITHDVMRDVVRERIMYSPRVQASTLARLGVRAELPKSMDVTPSVPPEIEAIVQEIGQQRQAQKEAKVFDLDRAIRRIVDSESEGSRDRALPVICPPTAVGKAGLLVNYDDGSSEVLDPEEGVNIVEESRGEIRHVTARDLKPGTAVISTDDAASSARFGAALIDAIARARPELLGAIALDRYWREVLREFRIAHNLTRTQVLARAQDAGFTNETALSILFYEKRSVWLPRDKHNLRALLTMLEEDRPGIANSLEATWRASYQLRAIASDVLSYIKSRALATASSVFELLPAADEVDPVIVPSLNLQASQIDGLFVVKRVVSSNATDGN